MVTTPSWYALLDGSPDDVVAVKRHFTTSGFSFDDIDGKVALSAPRFETCGDYDAVIDAATDLVDVVNVALRLTDQRYKGFELHGVVERRDGKTHRVMIARAGVYGVSGVAAVGIAGFISEPVRSREERIASLMMRDDRIADVAHVLAVRPMTWPAMTKAYETVTGMMSSKRDPGKARSDYPNLVAKGWLTNDESERFYHTAAYHRKGYPKSPIRSPYPMSYEDACGLITRLVWGLVDELEPS